MTPPAATAAGRAIPRGPAPRAPRRVSGPARPARGRTAPPRTRTRTATPDPLVLRALRRFRGLADSRFLDRLVRGRLWIPIVGGLLMGIVFMQVSMLKLNAGISRAVQTASTLERQNATMRADVSRLEAGSRVDEVAARLGMVVPADGSARYVNAQRGDAARAALQITAPSAEAIARTQALAAGSATTGTAAPSTATTTQTTVNPATAAPSVGATPSSVPTGTTAQTPTQTQAPVQTAAPTQQTAPSVQQTAAPSTQTATAQQAAVPSAGGVAAPTSPQG